MKEIRFGCQVGPVSRGRTNFKALYDELLADCGVASSLGYDSIWIVEHHFTDYYPIPSPLLLLSHVAAHFPDLGLGTCVVVTPWYQPLRLAEEIAMLSVLSDAHLHIGLGRGTARVEYDAYDVPMEESRQRFHEALDILRLALRGGPFTYDGEIVRVPREIELRPAARPNAVSLYGAIGSPQSASIMGELGLSPLSVGNFPFGVHERILGTWAESSKAAGHSTDTIRPLVLGCLVTDTDDEARAIARDIVPPFFEIQARHYEIDADPWRDIPGYEQFSRFFANLRRLSNPDNLEPWLELQLFGSPETIVRRLERYLRIGFNYIVLSAGSPLMEVEMRHRALERFATEIAPRFTRTGVSAPATPSNEGLR